MQRGIRWWVWCSAGLMVVGAFGAWATIGSVSVGGTVGDGWFVILAGALGAGLSYAMRGSRSAGAWPIIGGAVGLAVTAYDRSHLESFINHGGAVAQPPVQVGWGLSVALIASISMAIAGVVSLVQRPA
jgi:hypothetical protein